MAAPPRAALEPTQRLATILVVDDEPSMRRMIRSMLAGEYVTLEADGADEAIVTATEFGVPFELLLTDVVLPVSNGVVLSKLLRERGLAKTTLFMSGYGPEILAQYGCPAGAFLKKPFTPKGLRARVAAELGALVPA